MDEGAVEAVLELLSSRREPLELRQAALNVLKRLNFTSAIFRSRTARFTEILRAILAEDESPLREQAIEALSRFKDDYLQRRLVAGLEGKEEELVAPEKAIQLLGYDVHAGIFPLLREIVKDPPNAMAKNEAVRILAADSNSIDLIRETLLDKTEDRFVRQTSAGALSILSPGEFEEAARRIVFDDNDFDDIRATNVTLLEYSPAPGESGALSAIDEAAGLESVEADITAKIQELGNTASGDLKKASERFISKLKDRNR
jgi:HEAT repeat protein